MPDFKNLRGRRGLQPHKTSKAEIQDLLSLVERDLRDAKVQALSSDRRFLIAYEAGLNLSTIALYFAGYETQGTGHHWLTFQLLPEIMGSDYADLATYFDSCRAKRNAGTYDRGGQISDSDAEELRREVSGFKASVVDWLIKFFPEFLSAGA
jgi:hypothetical protein